MKKNQETHESHLPEVFAIENGIFMEYETTPLLYDDKGVYSPDSSDSKKKDLFIEKAETLLSIVDKICRKKALNSAIELIENMHRYRLPTDIIASSPEGASIEKNEQFITLSTHNTIDQNSKEKLEKTLATIDEIFEKEENPIETLKELSLSTLQNETYNIQGGAGKGFIDTARKNKTNFEYSFTPTPNGLYEFKLSTFINRNTTEAKNAFDETQKETTKKIATLIE